MTDTFTFTLGREYKIPVRDIFRGNGYFARCKECSSRAGRVAIDQSASEAKERTFWPLCGKCGNALWNEFGLFGPKTLLTVADGSAILIKAREARDLLVWEEVSKNLQVESAEEEGVSNNA